MADACSCCRWSWKKNLPLPGLGTPSTFGGGWGPQARLLADPGYSVTAAWNGASQPAATNPLGSLFCRVRVKVGQHLAKAEDSTPDHSKPLDCGLIDSKQNTLQQAWWLWCWSMWAPAMAQDAEGRSHYDTPLGLACWPEGCCPNPTLHCMRVWGVVCAVLCWGEQRV